MLRIELRRGGSAALAEMVAEASRSGEYRSPWLRDPRVWHHFKDDAEILRTLQRQWSTELGGALFAAIHNGDGDLSTDVALAYTDALARLHGVYRVLEAHADHRAIAREREKERNLLKSAGLQFSQRAVA
ncbi:MAG TPA: hypothetical protein VLI04_00470 [Nocardioidaceae bacterium]|nr:hypothetical protein [Nocardioidaceae bacterium]